MWPEAYERVFGEGQYPKNNYPQLLFLHKIYGSVSTAKRHAPQAIELDIKAKF
jgi:hypothetical protein